MSELVIPFDSLLDCDFITAVDKLMQTEIALFSSAVSYINGNGSCDPI